MVPETIREQISALRRLERWLRLVWGGAVCFALATVVMLIACLADWRIDLDDDTPRPLRWAMLFGQIGLWVVAGFFLVLRPLYRQARDDDLARWVERKLPVMEGQLISAEQPGAFTREVARFVLADQLLDPPDRRRLRWGMIVGASTLVLLTLSWSFFGRAFPVLIARQFLAEAEIPRGVRLLANDETRPSGEQAVLSFSVASKQNLEGETGVLRVHPEGRYPESYPLRARSARKSGEMVVHEFVAEIPPGAAPMRFQARLRDGRSTWQTLTYYLRPTVIKEEVLVLLPEHAGLRPNGQRYAQPQPRGDIVAMQGSQAVVRIETNTPIHNAQLAVSNYSALLTLAQWRACSFEIPLAPLAGPATLVGHAFGDRARRALLASEVYVVRRTAWVPDLRYVDCLVRVAHDGLSAATEFDLDSDQFEYQFHMTGLTGRNPFQGTSPRRTVTVLPDELPVVSLLGEDDDKPLPLGGTVRVGYSCRDSLGLDRALFRYRINDGPWQRMPLPETQADEAKGAFDVRRGVFVRSTERDQVHFHAVPSPDPNSTPGRLEGGGCFEFETRGIAGLKVGDTVEYCVEVYDRNPEPNRAPGRSEVRQKKIVSRSKGG